MANKIHKDELYYKIIGMVGDLIPPVQIAKLTGEKDDVISKRIKRYCNAKIMEKRNGSFYLLKDGLAIKEKSSACLITASNMASQETMRNHNFRVSLPLLNEIDNPQVYMGTKNIDYKPIGLKYQNGASIAIEKHTIQYLQKTAMVIMPDVEVVKDTPIEIFAGMIYDKLLFILEQSEIRTGIKFKKPAKDFFIAQVISQEIAFKNHPIAMSMKELKDAGLLDGIWIIQYDEDDNKPRIWIDFSHGSPEFEVGHAKHAVEDAAEVKKNLEPIINDMKSGQFKEWQNGVEILLDKYGKYLEKHLGTLDAMKSQAESQTAVNNQTIAESKAREEYYKAQLKKIQDESK